MTIFVAVLCNNVLGLFLLPSAGHGATRAGFIPRLVLCSPKVFAFWMGNLAISCWLGTIHLEKPGEVKAGSPVNC